MMYLIGTYLQKGRQRVSAAEPLSGSLVKVMRKEAGDKIDGFEVNTDIPDEETLRI